MRFPFIGLLVLLRSIVAFSVIFTTAPATSRDLDAYSDQSFSHSIELDYGSGVREDAAASDRSAVLDFLQTGSGTIAGAADAKILGTVSVKDFGAVGDGIADDRAAMQAAHDTGQIVYYPQGTYRFSGQLTIAVGGIIGAGKTLTNLNAIDTSSSAAIKFVGPYTPLQGGLVSGNATFHDFTLNGNGLKTTGAGLQFNSATNEVSFADLKDLQISYFPINVDFVNASLWKMIGCDILGHTVAGVRVNNTYENDAGDSLIMGNNIITSSKTAAQILHLSSGGLKIIGNKLLGARDGYSMQYTGKKETSILILANNSIENFSGKAINFSRVSAELSTFRNIIISGNQISVSLATPTAVLIENEGGSWLQSISITNNVFQLPGVTNSYGIALTGVTALIIQGNIFRGNGRSSQAIALTSCVDAKIGTNVYSNIKVPYSFDTPGANNTIALESQSGTAATSNVGWTDYYGMYQSAVTTVRFAQPFQVTPKSSDISFSLAAGDGSVSVMVVAVSKTELQFVVIASRTPGFAASINWQVRGVL